MAMALAFMLRMARAVGGDWALLPSLLICAAALHFGGAFTPGDLDHHNVQLTLTLAAMTALIIRTQSCRRDHRGRRLRVDAGRRHGNAALRRPRRTDRLRRLFALGGTGRRQPRPPGSGSVFAGAGFAAFIATVPASSWLVTQCDSYSLPQFSVALLSGLGLAAAAASPVVRSQLSPAGSRHCLPSAPRLPSPSTAFPQCLAEPLCRTGSPAAAVLARPCHRGPAVLERAHPYLGQGRRLLRHARARPYRARLAAANGGTPRQRGCSRHS